MLQELFSHGTSQLHYPSAMVPAYKLYSILKSFGMQKAQLVKQTIKYLKHMDVQLSWTSRITLFLVTVCKKTLSFRLKSIHNIYQFLYLRVCLPTIQSFNQRGCVSFISNLWQGGFMEEQYPKSNENK